MTRPAVLLDRDGTLNVPPGDGWVTSAREFVPLPGAFEAVARLNRAGWPACVVTNQSCIGRGLVSAEEVDAVNRECLRCAAERGATLDDILVCPHAPGDGCSCRKPLPGLLLRAAESHGYDLFRSYMVGDTSRDLLAGRSAGATALLVGTSQQGDDRGSHPESLTFPSLGDAVGYILSRGESG